jgi:hypothetical protein
MEKMTAADTATEIAVGMVIKATGADKHGHKERVERQDPTVPDKAGRDSIMAPRCSMEK